MKTLIRIFLGTSILIGMLYSTFLCYKDANAEPTYREGLITWKASVEQVNKHSSDVKFIFVVDFDKTGKEDVYVNASTFSSYAVGDRISLPRNKEVRFIVPAIISILVLTIILAFIIANLILWIILGDTLC